MHNGCIFQHKNMLGLHVADAGSDKNIYLFSSLFNRNNTDEYC